MVLKRLIESADGEREAFFERTVAKMSKMFEG